MNFEKKDWFCIRGEETNYKQLEDCFFASMLFKDIRLLEHMRRFPAEREEGGRGTNRICREQGIEHVNAV